MTAVTTVVGEVGPTGALAGGDSLLATYDLTF